MEANTFKKNIKWKLVIYAMILTLMLYNLFFFSAAGAEIKLVHIAFLLGLVISFFSTRRIGIKKLLLGLLLVLAPMGVLYRISDILEWFKSYIIWVVMIFFFVFAFEGFSNEFRRDGKKYIRIFLSVIALIQILGIVQFLTMNFLNIFFLQNMWGAYQFRPNQFGIQSGFYRAFSVYYEPSVFGWVSLSSLAVVLLHRRNELKHYMFFLGLSIAGIIVSLSASAMVFLVLLIGTYFLIDPKITKGRVLIVITLLACCLLLFLFTDLFAPITRLFTEINTTNTSGNERIMTPLQYVFRTFEFYPLLGRGFGQEGMVDKVGIIGMYESVNNAIFGIFVNLGSLAFVVYFTAFSFFKKKIKNNRSWYLIALALLSMYMSNGAYCSLDTCAVTVMLLSIGSAVDDIRIIQVDETCPKSVVQELERCV